jgi:hypothetical protein
MARTRTDKRADRLIPALLSDTLSEAEGCLLLTRLFRARGYAIARNVRFREYGVSFDIDGWDAKARVGFEFLSSEHEDHDDLTLAEFKDLMLAQQRGELAVFIIDEAEALSVAELTAAANDFLDGVALAPPTPTGDRRSSAAKKSTAKKSTGKKAAANTVAANTVAANPVAGAKKSPRRTARPQARRVVKRRRRK